MKKPDDKADADLFLDSVKANPTTKSDEEAAAIEYEREAMLARARKQADADVSAEVRNQTVPADQSKHAAAVAERLTRAQPKEPEGWADEKIVNAELDKCRAMLRGKLGPA